MNATLFARTVAVLIADLLAPDAAPGSSPGRPALRVTTHVQCPGLPAAARKAELFEV
jgi:hypothetical protein